MYFGEMRKYGRMLIVYILYLFARENYVGEMLRVHFGCLENVNSRFLGKLASARIRWPYAGHSFQL